MAPTIGETVDAVRDALQAGDIPVVPYLRDNPVVPCAMIAVDEVRYHEAFGLGNVSVDLTVRQLVSRVVDDNAFARVYEALDVTGAASVRAMIERDPTLCGTVDTLIVRSGGQIQPVDVGGVTYLAAEWQLTVHVS